MRIGVHVDIISGSNARWAEWHAGVLRFCKSIYLMKWSPGLVYARAGSSIAIYLGGLAREFQITLVAPSAYLPSPTDQVIRDRSGVFGESGELLGYQAKVMLPEQDRAFAQPRC